MNRTKWIGIVLFNLIISGGFFLSQKNAGYTALSTDLHNIIPVCLKKDHPELFQDDLYLNELTNVQYYTPFFVETLRLIKHTAKTDYLTALKFLLLITHFIFGIGWFLLFYKLYKDFWIALFLSVLIRGIIWLPGMEIWGISELWTMMPRTLYGALLPYPFVLFDSAHKKRMYVAAFLTGFIFNFHPITGLGGILIYISIGFWLSIWKKIRWQDLIFQTLFILLGMTPFIHNYFSHTPVYVDNAVFNEALFTRIPGYFSDPVAFFKRWFRLSLLFFFVPIFILGIISVRDKRYKKYFWVLTSVTLALLILPNLSVYVERFINNTFRTDLRMSFQLLRIQKLAILPGYFTWGYILLYVKENWKKGSFVIKLSFFVFLFLVSISKNKIWNGIPFMGDDIFRTILPENLPFGTYTKKTPNQFEEMLQYIENNTPENALFVGPAIIRSSTRRSVWWDGKGASMLIEGNPERFVWWYKVKIALDTMDNKKKWEFFKKNGVDYWLTKDSLPYDVLYRKNEWKLYQLK